MISVTSTGDYKKTQSWLKRMLDGDIFAELDKYGQLGVAALSRATPVDSSLTATSWSYKVIKSRRSPGIVWTNSNITAGGAPVAILIQYGHGTGTGGYIPGRDFINPAMKPIFDQITENVWKKVKS